MLWSCLGVVHGGDLRIGLLLPAGQVESASLRRGAQLGADHVNQSSGKKVSLWLRNRAGQWGTDGEEAGGLVLDESVSSLIAPPDGASSHLALQVAGRTATPVISLCPDSSVVGAGIPWMVRIVPSTRDEAQTLFTTLRTNATGRPFRWCALVPTERAGREASEDLRKAAETAGALLDRFITVAPGLKDYGEIEKQVLAAQSDGVLLWLEVTLAGRLVKALRAAGFKGQFAGPGRLQSAMLVSSAGNAAEGVLLPSSVLDSASAATASRFAAAYRDRFAEEPDTMARVAFDAVVLLASLLRGGNEPPHRAFPITSELAGASGWLKFDKSGNRLVPLELVQYRNGSFTPFTARGINDSPR